MLEPPEPEGTGAAKEVVPVPEEGNQHDWPLELKEPEVPTGSQDQQTEVDEVKGLEV